MANIAQLLSIQDKATIEVADVGQQKKHGAEIPDGQLLQLQQRDQGVDGVQIIES